MKFTDQIERDLGQSFTAAVHGAGLNNADTGLNYHGAWMTAAVVVVIALLWLV